jgi:adenylate cyclase
VDKEKWGNSFKEGGHYYRQGYMLTDLQKTIRIRVTDEQGFITIKGLSIGPSRPEYEYEIPVPEAKELLDAFCNSVVSKLRYKVYHANNLWEVDEFQDENAGLIIAELELESEDDVFELPDWIDKEVTGENKYYDSNLSIHPYKNW